MATFISRGKEAELFMIFQRLGEVSERIVADSLRESMTILLLSIQSSSRKTATKTLTDRVSFLFVRKIRSFLNTDCKHFKNSAYISVLYYLLFEIWL